MADTWADEGVRSPYATEPGSTESPLKASTDPSRPVATGSDSVEIEVDVSDSGTPSPPRVEPSVIARSGVREQPADAPSEDLSEDAPQFFDRKAIERMSVPPPSSAPPSMPTSGPQAPEVQAVVPVVKKDNLSTTFRTRGPGLQLLGVPIAWAAVAFIAVGLIVAVALALR